MSSSGNDMRAVSVCMNVTIMMVAKILHHGSGIHIYVHIYTHYIYSSKCTYTQICIYTHMYICHIHVYVSAYVCLYERTVHTWTSVSLVSAP